MTGGILLAALLILVLLVALVLFVPVCYEFCGTAEDHFSLGGKVSWLFRILSVRFSYEGRELTSEIRIFGIRRKNKPQLQEAPSEGEDPDASDAPVKAKKKEKERGNAAQNEEATETGGHAAEDQGEIRHSAERRKDQGEIQHSAEKPEDHSDSGDENNFEKKETIRERIIKIQKRIKQIPEKIGNIKNLILDETAKTAYGLMWSELLFLLKHFRFRKIQTNLTFSLGDPAWTGQVLGVLATFPFLYRYDVNVYPDFESDVWYVRGTFRAKGHAHLLHLLVSAFRLWRKKELRIFVKRLLK